MALSSNDAEETFGIKIKQYNNAVKELIEKGYLIQDKGNYYIFCEVSRKNKADNTKGNNEDNTKGNNELIPKDTRNNTDNTNNTKQFVF